MDAAQVLTNNLTDSIKANYHLVEYGTTGCSRVVLTY